MALIIRFLILQLTGLEPWILRSNANHCSTKPWWFGNEIGTRELNELIISWGPCIMLISTPIHYHRVLKFSGLNEYIYIYIWWNIWDFVKLNLFMTWRKNLKKNTKEWNIKINLVGWWPCLNCHLKGTVKDLKMKNIYRFSLD